MAFKTQKRALKEQLRLARQELMGARELIAAGHSASQGFGASLVQTLHLASWADPSESERCQAYARWVQETLGDRWQPRDIDEVLGVCRTSAVPHG